MKLLTVYNTCGIKGVENVGYYISALESIFKQEGVDHDIVVSACLNKISTLQKIKNKFKDIRINLINDAVPVNVSFNHTCEVFDDSHDAFLYIDSGIIMPDKFTIKKMIDRLESGPYSMVCSNVNDDAGVAVEDILINKYNQNRGDGILTDDVGSFVSVGSSLNLHCQIFSKQLKQYYNRIIPDIFAGFCTESVLSFLCAALKTRWAFCDDVLVFHERNMDGQSSGFSPGKWMYEKNRETYDHPFVIESYLDRFTNQYAKSIGLGFEECRNVVMHDKEQFDDNSFCINNDLKSYIKENLFLKNSEFNYSNIRSTVI